MFKVVDCANEYGVFGDDDQKLIKSIKSFMLVEWYKKYSNQMTTRKQLSYVQK